MNNKWVKAVGLVIVKTFAFIPDAVEALNWEAIEQALGWDLTKKLIGEMALCKTDEEVWDLLAQYGIV